uniref:Uncharacterized protein n=1 Tax=Triticum urartu TaxID=4572 RepID=A0A8R7UAW1_TRIUA
HVESLGTPNDSRGRRRALREAVVHDNCVTEPGAAAGALERLAGPVGDQNGGGFGASAGVVHVEVEMFGGTLRAHAVGGGGKKDGGHAGRE